MPNENSQYILIKIPINYSNAFKVEKLTQKLYNIYMTAAAKKDVVPRDVRDTLVRNFYYLYKVEVGELCKMSHTGKKSIKYIIKYLGKSPRHPPKSWKIRLKIKICCLKLRN
jgi:hypothetical protein